jgi:hypothetical protein
LLNAGALSSDGAEVAGLYPLFQNRNFKSQLNLTMSEFISTCPKCRQQILGDTAYVGMRVACPICLQEIVMPKPAQQTPPSSQGQYQAPQQGQPPQPNAGTGRSSPLKMVIAIGAVVLIVVLAVGGVLIAYLKGEQTTKTPATPVAAAPVADMQAGPDAFFTNRLTLDTPTSIVKITEVRQKNAPRCVEAIYNCVQKRSQLGIVIKGADNFSAGPNGELGDFLGWTFKNGEYSYVVSRDGRLEVLQGTKLLQSENGTWTEQNYQLRPPNR